MPMQPGAGGRSPCDLPLVSLSQGEIERLEREYARIEDLLPLSPLQEGLLFHALYDAQAPDVYSVQLVLGLTGALDAGVLEASAQALVARHASLRAGFRHEGLQPAGAGDRAVVWRCRGAALICRSWMRRSASGGWPRCWRRSARRALI